MKKYLSKVSWPTVVVALVLMYMIFQVDELKDKFTTKNSYFG